MSELTRSVLAIDQGTSSTKALLLDEFGHLINRGEVSLSQSHPKQGWVEQDPNEISASILEATAMATRNCHFTTPVTVGLSNQRESIVLWERASGKAISNILSWQDSRTRCESEKLRSGKESDRIVEISGLPVDPMFSAPKIKWLLDNFDFDRKRSRAHDICVGTIDSWLTRNSSINTIEIGNASRTQLLDLRTGDWSDELLKIFDIPREVLPEVRASNFRTSIDVGLGGRRSTLNAILGDSHAALYGHGIVEPGKAKVTFGTGSSVMTLMANDEKIPKGLCRSIAWGLGSEITYALEGNIRTSGATLSWLSRLLGERPEAIYSLANSCTSDGVFLVPAFNGLGAPWWNADARGLITGLTLGTTQNQLARAALESMALQVADLIDAMAHAGVAVTSLQVDGGASENNELMQLQSNLLQIPLNREASSDLSALGVAHLAGIEAGIWTSDQITHQHETFLPESKSQGLEALSTGWKKAIGLAQVK